MEDDVWAAPRCEILCDHYDRSRERRRESLFALGNGWLLVRGCAPEATAGEWHYPGTYRAGCYDALICEIAGERVETEALTNLPNWLPLSFRVRGARDWFSLDHGEILDYRQLLDLRHGVTRRELRIRDECGRCTRLCEERLVSMASPLLAALRLAIEPLNWSGAIEIRSAIDGAVANTNVGRYAPYPSRHLEPLGGAAIEPDLLLLRARTRGSAIAIAVALRTRLDGAAAGFREVHCGRAAIAEYRTGAVAPGQPLRVEKTAAIVTARDPAIDEPGMAALRAAREAGSFAALHSAHGAEWERLWRGVRIAAARPELALALALYRFHLLQTIAPPAASLDAGFPAHGWQESYFGQVFWDDVLVFPFLATHFPGSARALLFYRWRRLDAARRAARAAGWRGAMFPWRSAATGGEVTPPFQLNPLSGHLLRDETYRERHVGAAIVFNIWQYYAATGDRDFIAEYGAEIVCEIARFWASRAQFDRASQRYDIKGVVGPDEFHDAYPGAEHPGIDTNAYTNVMAAWALCRAFDLLDELAGTRGAALCRRLAIDDAELALWDAVSRGLRLAFHDDGIISQFAGYERLRPLDPARLAEAAPGEHVGYERVDWELEAEGDNANAYQIAKQADLPMLFYLLPGAELTQVLERLGYRVSRGQLCRTLAYYLARTRHDSSLSRIIHAGALARLDPAASWRLFQETLQRDANPMHSGSTEEGLHLGAMAGVIDVIQRHYLGLCPTPAAIRLDPAPPPELGPVSLDFRYRQGDFRLEWNGSRLRIAAAATNRESASVCCGGRTENLKPGAALEFDPCGRPEG